ncbi:MAG: ATP-dependent helicase HrpB [Sinobacteraceae bacterium]|nr:ATP-dependent helicase HrpB [Nevskiaceae bacterium]
MKRESVELPIVAVLPALERALAQAGRAVLAAPPGSGKTTLVPLALLEAPWLAGKNIVMLEPRRVAARAAAARMAALRGERVGETIGYQIRFERRVGPRTRVEVLTEGLLTRRLQSEPELPGVGLVIFDEFHERSLHADLALALTLDARAHVRPELRVLVMSATLDTERVAQLLDGAPVIEGGGRRFAVDVRHIAPRPGTPLPAAVGEGVLRALEEARADILAFLPGAREIRMTRQWLERRRTAAAVFPLYGELSSAEQDAALAPTRDGRRKIILATNLAQTSLTIEGVDAVVDSGLVRVARFDLGAGADVLSTQRISRAAAEQRAGRAGRLGPGIAWRLWSREQHGQLPAQDTPEILVADLSRFVLELACWGVSDPARMALLDAPPRVAWDYAVELLRALGAIDAQGRVTAHGRELARLPLPPRQAQLLLSAQRAGHGVTAAWIAAALDARAEARDLTHYIAALAAGRGDPVAAARAQDTVRQLLRLIGERSVRTPDQERIGALVAQAFPERLARRREAVRSDKEIAYLCADGGEARLPADDPLAQAPWLAIAHWEPGATRRIRLAAAIEEHEVLAGQAQRLATREIVRWDVQTEAVVAVRQRTLGAIVLESAPLQDGAEPAIRAAMLEGVRVLGLAALPWTPEARQWQARVLSLRAWRPQEDWPDVSDAALSATLERWLAPHLDGLRRREHLARLELASILDAGLEPAQRRALAQLAPTHLRVPSGSRVALEYFPDGAPPVLAVKLQELFGLRQTPTVNEGRTPVALHLLSPARRPIQVTQDLASFWARTYPEVKRELKGRYPKHPWPDDPLTAVPTARVVGKARS